MVSLATLLNPHLAQTLEHQLPLFLKARSALEKISHDLLEVTGIETELHRQGKMFADGNKADELEEFSKKVLQAEPGAVFVIPTDTVYCVVCRASDSQAIENLYKVKDRPSEKPVSLWIPSLSSLNASHFDPIMNRFLQSLWPSPVAVVLNKGPWLQNILPDWKTSRCGTSDQTAADSIAIRIPNSVVVMQLLHRTGPLVVTSANPSGGIDIMDPMEAVFVMAYKPEVKHVLHTNWAAAMHATAPTTGSSSDISPASTVLDCRDYRQSSEPPLGEDFKIGSIVKSQDRLIATRSGAVSPLILNQKWTAAKDGNALTMVQGGFPSHSERAQNRSRSPRVSARTADGWRVIKRIDRFNHHESTDVDLRLNTDVPETMSIAEAKACCDYFLFRGFVYDVAECRMWKLKELMDESSRCLRSSKYDIFVRE